MDVTTRIKLADVNGQPHVLMSGVPSPLRIGDPVGLRCRITRQNPNGRYEVLVVDAQFRVAAVGFDLGTLPRRQLLTVECIGKPPVWASVKKPPLRGRLAPAIHPRTPVA